MTSKISALEAYRLRAENTNVNDVTLLATDYLNHFNEALMLAELVVDMPDMLDDFITWSPRSYTDHFQESGIADRELAIEAYEFSPPEYKEPFETTIELLNTEILSLQAQLQITLEKDENSVAGKGIVDQCLLIRKLIDQAGAIINGQPCDLDTSSSIDESENEGGGLDQDEINAMFG